MTAPIKNGGPAFPAEEWLASDDPRVVNPIRHPGMTLRDYFAAQALTNPYTDSDSYPEKTAEWAYQIADAMIKARGAA